MSLRTALRQLLPRPLFVWRRFYYAEWAENNKELESSIRPFVLGLRESLATGAGSDVDKVWASRVIACLDKVEEKQSAIAELEDMWEDTTDKEFKVMAEKDIAVLDEQLEEDGDSLLAALVRRQAEDNINKIFIELNSGAGGKEAMLFTREMHKLYLGYAKFRSWTATEVEIVEGGEPGSFRSSVICVHGEGTFRELQLEGGVHRVQRVPLTEKLGRMQTSTCSVVIMPEPLQPEAVLNSKDVRQEVMRSSGPGGQHVNTTESRVRLTHIPTNTVVDCQSTRSQLTNRELAYKRLSAILYDAQVQEQTMEQERLRKDKAGGRDRSDKIRTYNFQQDRVTDHRIRRNFPRIEEIMAGGPAFHVLITALGRYYLNERLQEILHSASVPVSHESI